MPVKQKTYYCKNHGWVVANPCLTCDNPTKEFERRGGVYYIKDVAHPLPSVTQIVGVIDKPGLLYWAARTAATYAFENPGASLEEATGSINRVKTGAGLRGGGVHAIIDSRNFSNVPENLKGYIEAYIKFAAIMPHEIILREKIVYTQDYAGRFDALATFSEGKTYLLDYKTSSDLYPITGLQLSAYRHATHMEPEYGSSGVPFDHHIDGLMAIRLGVDGTFDVKEYPDDYDAFMATLEVFKWQQASK